MRFDERARRAAQGIHRAVEVMEMSSTKTPQEITRFDQYRARTSRNKRIVAIAVGVGVPLLLLVGAVRLLGSDPDPKVPLAPPSTSVSPAPVSGRSGVLFEAPFRYTLPPGWTVSEETWLVRLDPPEAPWSIAPNEKIRFYVLDPPAGDTVTIVISVTDARYFDDVIDLAAPVVDSFKFLD
jgi:hypothetical protein